MATGGFTLNRTHKMIGAVLAGVLVLALIGINWAGGKAANFVKEKAAQQTFLKGKLSIGDVGASFSGAVWAKDIVWNDPSGKLVAKIPRINISVRMSDILSASLGAQSIETIILEQPELHLAYDEKTGLNVMNLVNIDEKAKDKKEEAKKPPAFRGVIEIEKGFLEIVSGKNVLKYEGLDSKISYKEYPKVTGTMQAKQNKADFAGKLELLYDAAAGDKLKLEVEGRSIALKDFFQMIPVKSNLKLSEGSIPVLKAKAELIGQKPLQMQAEGNFEGIKADTDGISIAGVKGNFKGSQDEVELSGLTGTLNGQAVKVDGKVNISKDPYVLNLNVSSDSFSPEALSPGLGIKDPLSFKANIAGTPDNPLAKGNFNMPKLRTDQMEIVDASGDFNYAGGVVHLTNARAGVYGGIVTAVGTVKMADKSFVFDLHGSGINSTAMTETKIHGPLSFNAHATGVGDPNAAAANGSFNIGKGDFAGIPFNLMKGNFSKLGSNMSFSNIEVHTLAGVAKTNATIGADGKVRFDMIDVSDLSKKNVLENAAEGIEKERKKVIDGIKKIF